MLNINKKLMIAVKN